MADENLSNLNRDANVTGLDGKTDQVAMAQGADALDSLLLTTQPESEEAIKLKERKEASLTDEQRAENAKAEEAKKAEADAKAKEEADKKAKEEADKAATLTDEQRAEKEKADKAAAEKKAQEEAAVAKKEEFEEIQLPPHAKPGTTESFAKVKLLAKQRITALSTEKEQLENQVKELQAKQAEAGKLPVEVEKELKELRDFRQSVDIETSPKFKAFDKAVESNNSAILAKLKEANVSETSIEEIKKHGVEGVDWEKILPVLPPVVRRFIETKLVANEEARMNKAAAITEAKTNLSEFLKEQEQARGETAEARRASTETHFKEISGKVAWMKKIEPPKGISEDDKKKIEAHNAFVGEIENEVKAAMEDDSPEMRAILTLGYVQMLRLQKEVPYLKTTHEADKKKLETELNTVKAALKEKEDFIAKIKKSSSMSLKSDIGGPETTTGAPSVHTRAGDHLDALRAQAEAGK